METNTSTTIRDIIGYPSKESRKEFWILLKEMRFLFTIYVVIFVLYLFFFLVFKCFSTKLLSQIFGEGFGVSFSASALEDLIMFVLLSLAVTVISIKVSTKSPRDYDFDSRIRAIINSSNIDDADTVIDFVKSNVSNLLAYNKYLLCEVTLIDYYPDDNVFHLLVERTQIVTNMCKDRDFISQNEITIKPDQLINNSYGRIHYLGNVDVRNFNKRLERKYDEKDNYELKTENAIEYDFSISRDAQLGVRLEYSYFTGVGKVEDLSDWSYCGFTKYTSEVRFVIHNRLKSKQPIVFNLRKINQNDTILDLAENKKLIFGSKSEHKLTGVQPDEELKFYIFPIS